jgi:hypothetical protein
MRILVLLGFFLLGAAAPSHAGVFGDDLTRCLVDSTTKTDRADLVRWIFVAMAQHPLVSSMSNVKVDDKEKANKDVGALFMRLLTETCKDKTKAAIQAEGAAAIQLSFQVLGQVAAREIFADPSVVAVMSGLEKHVDSEKLKELGGDIGVK